MLLVERSFAPAFGAEDLNPVGAAVVFQYSLNVVIRESEFPEPREVKSRV